MATLTTIEQARKEAIAGLEAAERARHQAAITEYERTRQWSILDWEMIDRYMEAGDTLDEALGLDKPESE